MAAINRAPARRGDGWRVGFDDLAWTSAERALDAARWSDAPELETVISLQYLAWTLVRQGRLDDAERVAVTAAEQVQPAMLAHYRVVELATSSPEIGTQRVAH